MGVISKNDTVELLRLIRTSLEEGQLEIEDILREIAFYHGGVLADDTLFVNSCMKILEVL